MKSIISVLLMILVGCAAVPKQPKIIVPVTYLYDNITIEIQPTHNSVANQAIVTKIVDSLHFYGFCHKDSIKAIIRKPVHSNINKWLRPNVLRFAYDHRTLYDLDKTDRHLIVFIAVLPGNYVQPRPGEPTGGIIGLAFSGIQYISLFHNFSHPVIIHEFGHIVGLVDRRTREAPLVNPKRPNHCNDANCVMFWQANRNGLFGPLCIRDLNNLIKMSNED